jgi:hypothetical protein
MSTCPSRGVGSSGALLRSLPGHDVNVIDGWQRIAVATQVASAKTSPSFPGRFDSSELESSDDDDIHNHTSNLHENQVFYTKIL